jgi:calcineurin-like phosphoesterase family protein
LGDWSFDGIDNIWNFRKRIKCKDIRLIMGNHDKHIINNKVLPNCMMIPGISHKISSIEEIDNDYKKLCYEVHAEELFTFCERYAEIEIDKIRLCLMHFPIEEWNNRETDKCYMINGHVHGCENIKDNRLDVGIDNAFKLFGEYRPFMFKEIVDIIEFRKLNIFKKIIKKIKYGI